MLRHHFRILGVVFSVLILSGCNSTLSGIQTDMKRLMENGVVFSAPAQACERFYNSKSLYRQCLNQEVRSSLSSQDVQQLSTQRPLPGCSKKRDFPAYRECQVNAYVAQEVKKIESARRKKR